ncbi:MAG: HTTM domain-containing protein [Acidimicrobiia bacterium]
MSITVRADAWLLEPAPARRLAALRILVGGYALVFLLSRLPGLLQVTRLPDRQFEPVGPLWWMDSPLSSRVAQLALFAVIALAVAFVAGWRHRVTGPAFALGFLMVTTYRVSFGHILHTDHLPAAHVLVLGFAPSAAAWSLDARRARSRSIEPPDDARFGWPIRLMAVITAIGYVLAGLAKLRYGGNDWLTGDVLRNHIAYDNLRKALIGTFWSHPGGWIVQYAWLFPPLAIATTIIELGAVAVATRGRLRTIEVGLLWLFHVGTAVFMAIGFPYPLSGIAFACCFRAERIIEWVLVKLPTGSRPASVNTT